MDINLTERALADQMKKLLSKKPLSKISIKDLTDACHINRKTYYYHFKDKYDLVHFIFMDEFYYQLDYDSIDSIWDFLIPLSEYFYSNKAYYRHAFEEKCQNSFSEFFADLMESILKEHFEDEFKTSEYKVLYADYITAGMVYVFKRWLESYENIPPEKFISIMKNAIHGLAEHVLSEDI